MRRGYCVSEISTCKVYARDLGRYDSHWCFKLLLRLDVDVVFELFYVSKVDGFLLMLD